MKKLILDSIKTLVIQRPEIIDYLKGDAAWYAGIYAYKQGEAPDDDLRRKDERRLANQIKIYLQEQQERIIKIIKKPQKSVDDYIFEENLFWENENELFWLILSAILISTFIHGVEGGIVALGSASAGLSITNLAPEIIQYANTYKNQWLSYINNTSRDFVHTAITEWIKSGDPLSELVKTLSNPELGIYSEMRAKRIATTEVTRLYAMGNKMAWEKAGYKEFTWQTANDERVCQICGDKHGKVYPLSQMNDIPAHVNCRCWATPVVPLETDWDWS